MLVLQHPQEAAHAKNSVRLLRLSLAQCRVEVGERFADQTLAGWLHDGVVGANGSGGYGGAGDAAGRSLLLCPASATTGQTGHAALNRARPSHALPCPTRLVLLDGTWRQARALLRAHPRLQQLPRWALPDPSPSRYAIRRAQRAGQRSTLEAASAALGLLEDRPAFYGPLLDAFSAWLAAEAARRMPAQTRPAFNPGPPAPPR